MATVTEKTGKIGRRGSPRRRISFVRRIGRLMRLRLVIPMVRSRQPPENTARAVAVGLFWALTPTFGIQMALSAVHWYVARTFFKRDFSVVVAMAWTWVTNLFTLPIAYYIFFLTGQILLGRWDDLSGYESFQKFWVTAMGETGGDPTSIAAWETYFAVIVEGWGLAMLVGSLPLAFTRLFCRLLLDTTDRAPLACYPPGEAHSKACRTSGGRRNHLKPGALRGQMKV